MRIIGHRGARALAPENTLAAIEAGIKAGADELEIDVRVTKDDIPVVVHDRRINGALVFLHTLAELKAQKSDLPTLAEVIRKVDSRAPLIIEIKKGEPTEPIIKVLQEFLAKKWQPEDFRLGSKSQKILLTVHKSLPDIPTVVIEAWSGIRATRRARQLQTTFICMNHRFLWWFFVSAAHTHGFKLSVYTLNDPTKAAAWEKHGLYGVVTDHPESFKK